MSTTTAKPLKISDTALKFGPEWLRALSHGDTAVSPPPSPGLGAPRYKLAQHRYGREEMLALCDRNIKAPDDLTVAPPLYIEKTQLPLALIQPSDEEMRMWQRGVNSDVVLKLQGRGAGGPSMGSGGPSSGVAAVRGGRGGGSVDRGRGRGRGIGSAIGAYNRGTSYEDDGGEHGRRDGQGPGFGRGARPFERSQSSSERVWIDRPERNGTEEWNGTSTSPRKEFGVGRPGGTGDNWRSREALRERAEGKGGEEEDGWRTAGRGDRWAQGRSGWRGGDRDAEREGGGGDKPWAEGTAGGWKEDGGRPVGSGFYKRSGGGHNPGRRAWDEGDALPEWAAEDMQGGGTFDASGAFRDERWPDEDPAEGRKRRAASKTEASANSQPGGAPAEDGPAGSSSDAQGTSENKEGSTERPGSGPPTDKGGAPGGEPNASRVNMSPARPAATPPVLEQAVQQQQQQQEQQQQHPGRLDMVEDGLEHAQAVVSDLVAHLVEDEDLPKASPSPPNHNAAAVMDQWFYRDPQGDVQGPFAAAEMTEWFNSGYFTMALSVRRACDERYVQLGELTKMLGRLPFLSGTAGNPHHPPLKAADVHPMVAEQEKLQMIQQQLMQQQLFQAQMQQMAQQQQHALRQQAVLAKLSQMDGWAALSPVQQQQVLNQHMANLPPLPQPHPVPVAGADPLLQQLRLQMEAQAKLQAEMMIRKDQSLVNHLHLQPQVQPQPQQQPQQPKLIDPAVLDSSVGKPDPIHAFVQQLLGQGKAPAPKPPQNNSGKPPDSGMVDPIQSLIQQAQWGGPGGPGGVEPSGPVLGGGGGPGHHVAPGFHGMAPGPGLVPWPPQQSPHVPPQQPQPQQQPAGIPSVWELEAAKAEEAKRLMEQHQHQQMAELQRREEEEKQRMKEEEERRRREIQEREEERKRMEEMRREAEEMRRRELQQQMEEKRRRQAEEEAMKLRKQREIEEQQLKQQMQMEEEQRMRREEEQRLRKEAAEQQRRQQETLQRLQEAQVAAQAQNRAVQQQQQQQQIQQQQAQAKAAQAVAAPWAQAQQHQQQGGQQQQPSLTMAEIQKLQEEKEAKERAAAQALKAEQNARAAALLQQQQQQAAIKLRWASKQASQAGPGGPAGATKSLAEIQAEEAAQLARQKEKEAKERANQAVNLNLAAAGAWGGSHGSSAWASGRTAASVVAQHQPQQQPQPPPQPPAAKSSAANHANNDNSWKMGTMGFWEDPNPPKAQSAAKAAASAKAAAAAKPAAASQATAKSAAAPQPSSKAPPSAAAAAASTSSPATAAAASSAAAGSNKKSRSNKEEEAVRKLFGQPTTAEKKDSFSAWCFEYLKKVQAPIDVPTFVSFLKDVESPFEVQDYVRSYLGEGKEAKEFAKQFLEQRSRWRQQQRNVQQYEEDNMCIPAKAVNPGQPSDFHEVKSKSKKSKKKMQKVDASLLGFSVSAPTDRINVGERDFVDGM